LSENYVIIYSAYDLNWQIYFIRKKPVPAIIAIFSTPIPVKAKGVRKMKQPVYLKSIFQADYSGRNVNSSIEELLNRGYSITEIYDGNEWKVFAVKKVKVTVAAKTLDEAITRLYDFLSPSINSN
jgi:hypothetical protein